MRAIALLLLLSGCATPACKPVTETVTKTEVINRYIVAREVPAHSVLLSDYAQTLESEKPLVVKSKAPTIDCLITLDAAARAAFAPIEQEGHRATKAEITKAIDALGSLRAGVKLQACPKR